MRARQRLAMPVTARKDRTSRVLPWPEESNPQLEALVEQKVLPKFPELKRDEFCIIFGATKQGTLAQVQTWLQRLGRTVHRRHLITVNYNLAEWSEEELVAIIAHEMGHLANSVARVSPQTWEEQELAATSQAIARGFITGFQHIFRRLCSTPCWHIEEAQGRPKRIRIRGRHLAGLYCVAGGGLFQAYCPFANTPEGRSLIRSTWMRPVKGRVKGVCALCRRPLGRKKRIWMCGSCGMLFHEPCLHSYLNHASICPACRHPVTGGPGI